MISLVYGDYGASKSFKNCIILNKLVRVARCIPVHAAKVKLLSVLTVGVLLGCGPLRHTPASK